MPSDFKWLMFKGKENFMKKVLIVEDDEAINNLIANTLRQEMYDCYSAFDGKEGADMFEQRQYDLVLLDLMLPEINGYELLEFIKPTDTPVIIISAMGQVQDRIKGLRMGADDYLAKPFQIGELLARVESVLRRAGRQTDEYTYKDIVVNTSSRTVLLKGVPVELTMKEFDLLVVLLQHKNVALSRCYLYESVWEEEYTGETRTLDNHIQRLRKKLDLNDNIQTVFRIGYRLK